MVIRVLKNVVKRLRAIRLRAAYPSNDFLARSKPYPPREWVEPCLTALLRSLTDEQLSKLVTILSPDQSIKFADLYLEYGRQKRERSALVDGEASPLSGSPPWANGEERRGEARPDEALAEGPEPHLAN